MTKSTGAYLWVEHNIIHVEFPSTKVGGKGHSVQFNADEAGIRLALELLKTRAIALDLRLGTDAAPTQHQIEQRRAHLPKSKPALKSTPRKPSLVLSPEMIESFDAIFRGVR